MPFEHITIGEHPRQTTAPIAHIDHCTADLIKHMAILLRAKVIAFDQR